jgi:hypothetical protein
MLAKFGDPGYTALIIWFHFAQWDLTYIWFIDFIVFLVFNTTVSTISGISRDQF